MKVTAYLRVAKKHPAARGPKAVIQANATPSSGDVPIYAGPEPLPTVAFAISLDIPDELFKRAEQVVAEIVIPPEAATIAAEVKQEE
jgi:hypothetical protein